MGRGNVNRNGPTVDDVLPHIEAMTRDNDRLRAEMKEIVEREKP
jgi:hypothetical protein